MYVGPWVRLEHEVHGRGKDMYGLSGRPEHGRTIGKGQNRSRVYQNAVKTEYTSEL